MAFHILETGQIRDNIAFKQWLAAWTMYWMRSLKSDCILITSTQLWDLLLSHKWYLVTWHAVARQSSRIHEGPMTAAILEYSVYAEWSQNNKLQVHTWSINLTLALSLISSHFDDRKGEGFEALGFQFCLYMSVCPRRIIIYHCNISFKSYICF
jgi:hypothetical protein